MYTELYLQSRPRWVLMRTSLFVTGRYHDIILNSRRLDVPVEEEIVKTVQQSSRKRYAALSTMEKELNLFLELHAKVRGDPNEFKANYVWVESYRKSFQDMIKARESSSIHQKISGCNAEKELTVQEQEEEEAKKSETMRKHFCGIIAWAHANKVKVTDRDVLFRLGDKMTELSKQVNILQ